MRAEIICALVTALVGLLGILWGAGLEPRLLLAWPWWETALLAGPPLAIGAYRLRQRP